MGARARAGIQKMIENVAQCRRSYGAIFVAQSMPVMLISFKGFDALMRVEKAFVIWGHFQHLFMVAEGEGRRDH